LKGGHGGTCLQSQYLGAWGRRVVSSRPAWAAQWEILSQKKNSETKPNKIITYQKIGDGVNAVQKVYLNSSEHLPIKELCQINNLTLPLKEFRKRTD
jgi:hypothetical protein